MKKIISLLIVVALVVSVLLCGCSQTVKDMGDAFSVFSIDGGSSGNKAVASTDKYRSYYQIFVNSFCDSNGDETGDIPGITSQLDYLNDGDPSTGNDLGIDGLWLTPIMPSKSYHKYDVEDYFNIDPDFGTLDDFDTLIAECNKRGINVIIDLVINHSSSNHPYFKQACEELANGNEDGYAKYYTFSKTADDKCNRKVTNAPYYYEGRFSPEMPDWNLDYEGTRDYLMEIAKFWIDRGVAGFRLDAVKYFYLGDNEKSCEFLKWFYDSCKAYKEDIYMVGEDWDDAGNIYDMYESGIDSLFNFKFASASGEYVSCGRSGQMQSYVKDLKKYNDNILKRNPKAINANFVTNHDMVRLYNTLDEDENKFTAMLYLLSPGNSFTYYGEEIGIEAPNTTNDASYRTPMIFDNDNLPDIFVNGVAETEPNELGGVKQQLEQPNSLLNTYRALYDIKLKNPALSRGTITDVVTFDDVKFAGYFEEYDGTKLLVLYNGDTQPKEQDLSDKVSSVSLNAQMVVTETGQEATDEVRLNGNTIVMPPKSVAILQVK